MKIINSISEIYRCFDNGVFSVDDWRNYSFDISKELYLLCEEDIKNYNFDLEVVPVLNNVMVNSDKLDILNISFEKVMVNLKQDIQLLFDKDIEFSIILYLGLCNGAGWVTIVDGIDTILLGIEKIIELGWYEENVLKALIYHEIGHVWHKVYGNIEQPTTSVGDDGIQQLYQEGIAMRCEQILGNDDSLFHQYDEHWLNWCDDNLKQIKEEFWFRISNNISTSDFFGDWTSYQGHSDVGYYLGAKYVKYLENYFSLVAIANLSIAQLKSSFMDFVREINVVIK
ncbi:MAG: hypothetical protein WBO70_01220 [Erysipelotrichaceae bacterium]